MRGSVAASQVRGVHRVGAVAAKAFCQKLVRRLGSGGQSVICRRRGEEVDSAGAGHRAACNPSYLMQVS